MAAAKMLIILFMYSTVLVQHGSAEDKYFKCGVIQANDKSDSNDEIGEIQDIRLVGGTTDSVGTVEVLARGEWGTVCDDFWGIEDAEVVCRQLGFPRAIQPRSSAYFGSGSGRIWLDNVACTGQEVSLEDCTKSEVGVHNCEHDEDAGVECALESLTLGTTSPEQPSPSSYSTDVVSTVPTIATTPQGLASTSWGIVSTPQVLASTSLGLATTSLELASSQSDLTSTPPELASTSREQASTPHELAPTPGELASTPQELASNPLEQASTPQGIAPTPGGQASTPQELASNPLEQASTPQELAPKPGELASTPQELASNPLEQASTTQELAPTLGELASTPQELASNPLDQASTPQGIAPTPGDQASTPQELASNPLEQASSPQELALTPGDQASTPQELASTPGDPTPGDLASTPQELASNPLDQASTPQGIAPTPGDQASTPQELALTPGDQASTPQELASTPGELASTPQELASNPLEQASTPQELASTPGDRAPTPQDLATTPPALATTPRELTSTPQPTPVPTTNPLAASTQSTGDTTPEAPTTLPGCFVPEAGRVLAEGGTYIDMNCSRNASCIEGALITDGNFGCSVYASCEERGGVRGCYCGYGYYGNGVTCRLWADCWEVGNKSSGVYTIKPKHWTGNPFDVYCSMDEDGGWTVFQRRVNGSVDFYQNWAMYKHGFGDVHHEYWLGNEKLYHLTRQGNYEIRVDLIDQSGQSYHAKYDLFRIEDESDKYMLSQLGAYDGTAGDSLRANGGYMFSTHDQDNDIYSGECAEWWHGGWWYKFCGQCNPNGDYSATSGYQRIFWNPLSDRMRYTEMKIRPV